MNIENINIGDELLMGQVVNTNATWMEEVLSAEGLIVTGVRIAGDTVQSIREAIDHALLHAEVVLMTGGLGPTKDDITKQVLCDHFNTGLIYDEPTFRNIERLVMDRGQQVGPHHKKQAEIPGNSKAVANSIGSAPGLWIEYGKKVLVAMPGVPFEMKAMMQAYIVPSLAGMSVGAKVYHKTILVHGVGETRLAELISSWSGQLPANMKLAFLPQPGIVRLRLSVTEDNRELAETAINSQVTQLEHLIPELIFGYDESTLESVVGTLLREKSLFIATAESCTGGYLAHLVTSVAGSSDYFAGSVIAYSNQAKETALGVSHSSLASHGAVSRQVAIEMAEGARDHFQTGYAIAVTGIAGPGGGTEDKPVGTAWIAVAGPGTTITRKFRFGDHRLRNIRRAALAALNMLRLELLS